MLRDARLVAIISTHFSDNPRLTFRIQENFAWEIGQLGKYHSDVWVTTGENSWSVVGFGAQMHPALPPSVSFREFFQVMGLLAKSQQAGAEGILRSYFWELELYPAYDTGKSWLKDIMPLWFDSFMKIIDRERQRTVQEVMES